ncbi:MAG: isopentenyl phosphate kinase [Candidatus Diapherotrites archaeon]|nr:isopentenyl phosphate kinase [Candidatus Diapherotrites archaeon]
MKELVLIKLGGSLITDKRKKEKARLNLIASLAHEIKPFIGKKRLIVAHGGGSFPHYPAKEYRVNEGILNKNSLKGFCLTHDAAARLNRIVVGEFLKAGINAISMQPSSFMFCKNGKIIQSNLCAIEEALQHNILPVPYGDAVFDTEKGITIISTEQILSHLALKLKAKRIIVAGIVNGVYTSDPLLSPCAKLIPKITAKNFPNIRNMLSGSHGVDVTGGMLSKVEDLVALSNKGIRAQIIGAEQKGNLKKAILGKRIGTIIG